MGRNDPGSCGQFTTTHWSVVLQAADKDATQAAQGLAALCQTYWYPLFTHIRRQGYSPEDAEDLTQGFLLQLLERNSFAHLDQSRGRLRSFLLAALSYYLSDAHDRVMAQKRGGGRIALAFDAQAAEKRYRLEPRDERSPDKLFERRWAVALLEKVLTRLEHEFNHAGKAARFKPLSEFLVAGSNQATYADLARRLHSSRDAAKKAVHRMRHRYSELFREEIAQTLENPAEVDEEMRYLCAVLARQDGSPV